MIAANFCLFITSIVIFFISGSQDMYNNILSSIYIKVRNFLEFETTIYIYIYIIKQLYI